MGVFGRLRNIVFLLSSKRTFPKVAFLFKRHVLMQSTQACDRLHIYAQNECDNEEISKIKKLISDNLLVYDDFITEEEEIMLYEEVRHSLETKSYQHEHWDDVSLYCMYGHKVGSVRLYPPPPPPP